MSQSQLDQLLNVLLPLADDMLRKYGEAYPLGAGIDMQDQVQLIAGRTQPGQQVTTAKLLEQLREFFIQGVKEGKFKAVSLAFDSFVTLPGEEKQRDAITVFLEDAEGASMLIYRPYTKELDGAIKYDQLYGLHGAPEFFTHPGAPSSSASDSAPITSPSTSVGSLAGAPPVSAPAEAPAPPRQPVLAGMIQNAPPPPAGKPPIKFEER